MSLHMEFLEACSYSSVKFTLGYSRDVNPLPPGMALATWLYDGTGPGFCVEVVVLDYAKGTKCRKQDWKI